MTSVEKCAVVTLRKPLEGRLRAGHPWLFRDAIDNPPRLPDGAPVLIRGRDRRPVAKGFWDARSPIAVRVMTTDIKLDVTPLLPGRLQAALALRRARIDGEQTTAFRWVHGEADQLPGLHIDLYGDVAVVRFDGAGPRAFYRKLTDAMVAAARPLPLRAVVDRQERLPLLGDPVPALEVREGGLRFAVDLLHGQKGGLFLDQRENRAEIGRRARGRSVLNLFGYTGGFSLYAAAGGASRTDTVDVAKPALAAARANFDLNRLPLDNAGFHPEDAFAFLAAAAQRGQRWDIVISDPPSFAPRASALGAARKAYRRLHRMAAAVTAEGGLFCPASCSSHFPRAEFLASVEEGVRAAGRRYQLEGLRGAGFDHPTAAWFPEGDYLKFGLVRL
jgi:23S rRNA (cytosine1962-C5)-methyltransferase